MALPTFAQKVKPNLAVKEVADIYLRKNFQALEDYFQTENQLVGFKFFELSFTDAESARVVAHGLGYIPQDIVLLKITGTGKVQFDRSAFTRANLSVSSTGPCVIRFFVGSYWQAKGAVTDPDGTVQEFQALVADSSDESTLVLFPLTAAQMASNSYPGATSSTYVIRSQDESVFVDCASGPKSIVLPTAKGVAGEKHLVKKVDSVDANLLTITFTGAETGDSRTSFTLSFLNQSIQFESDGTNWRILSFYNAQEILHNESATGKTATATDRYPLLDANSLDLTPGIWRVFGNILFANGGGSPVYTATKTLWAAANGADTNVAPAALTTLTGLEILTSRTVVLSVGVIATSNDVPAPEYIFKVTSTSTIYLDGYVTCTTAANTLLYAFAQAERIGP